MGVNNFIKNSKFVFLEYLLVYINLDLNAYDKIIIFILSPFIFQQST